MAVPTFTSITPNTGHTGGTYLAKIVGTNFEQHADPPSSGYVGTDWPAAMSVTINGRECTDVRVYSPTLLTCVVPAYRGAPSGIGSGAAVDVVLSNLSDPLVETVTETDGFTYQRRSMVRTSGALVYIVRELVETMRRQIIDNIAPGQSPDYDGSTADGLNVVQFAEAPGVAVFGPDLRRNKFRRAEEQAGETTPDLGTQEFTRAQRRRVNDLLFELAIFADEGDKIGLTNLTQEVVAFFQTNPKFEIPQDSTNPASTMLKFDMVMTSDPRPVRSPSSSGVLEAAASFEIRGVKIATDEDVTTEWGRVLDSDNDPELEWEQK